MNSTAIIKDKINFNLSSLKQTKLKKIMFKLLITKINRV